jgi:hypothetical protein
MLLMLIMRCGKTFFELPQPLFDSAVGFFWNEALIWEVQLSNE